MFYYLLGNISPWYCSRLKMTQLVCVVSAEVMKEHGVDTILKPPISDIQKLEKVIYDQASDGRVTHWFTFGVNDMFVLHEFRVSI